MENYAKLEAERLIKKFTFADIYFTAKRAGALQNAKFCAGLCAMELISTISKEDKEVAKLFLEEVLKEIENYSE